MKFRTLTLALGLSGVLVSSSVFADDAAATAKPAGDAIYASSFKDMKDNMKSLSQFKNKVMVIYFWATWCVPCKVETPNLVKLYDEYKTKGVEVVGIALDNGDKVRAFVKDNNVTYPIFYGGHNAVELGKTLGNSQGAIPFTVVIDRTGKVAHTFQGDLPNSQLEAILNPLIT